MNPNFNKNEFLNLFDHETKLKEDFGILLADYNREDYFKLQSQLWIVKDFLIVKRSLKNYLELFINFKINQINAEDFISDFFDIYHEDEEFLKILVLLVKI